MPKMKTSELEALLGNLQRNAVGELNSTIGHHRADLMKRYHAKPYGDEVEGRTSIVDTTIRDTVEAIKPEIMDIFFGGDEVVVFDPVGPEDIDGAKQETDVCNHVFLQQNDGFMLAYNWFTDALFQKVGYVKRFWDDRKRVEVEEYDDLSPEEAAFLLQELDATSDDVEILERSGGIDEETGQVEPLYLKLRRTSTEKRYSIVNVPPEEVLVHPQWTKVSLSGCPFVAHKRPVTVSDLIQMGFNRAQAEEMPVYDRKLESEEAQERHSDQDWHEGDSDVTDMSMREVLVFENYVLADYDGDGIAEQLQVFTDGNGTILKRKNGKLAIEYVTDQPFEAETPLPVPHRHYGLSEAELVEDLQRLKTVFTRQMADNQIQANNPDEVVDEDQMTANTVEDLSVTGFARVIRIPGGPASYQKMPVPDMISGSLAAISYVDELKEARTGVTRFGQGLDPDALGKHTLGGTKMIMSAGQKKILMIARIFAETGFKSLFVNMHRDLRSGPVKKIAIELNNEFVTVNPRQWRRRTDVTVSVGLGTGDRDIQIARLSQILEEQKLGYAQGVVPYEKLYHTYSKILELSGFKDVPNFFPSPEEMQQAQQGQEQQPDPAMIIAQLEAQKIQGQLQVEQLKLQQKQAELEVKKLDVLMKDDRERDLAAAKIEADEAARMDKAVNGQGLTQRG